MKGVEMEGITVFHIAVNEHGISEEAMHEQKAVYFDVTALPYLSTGQVYNFRGLLIRVVSFVIGFSPEDNFTPQAQVDTVVVDPEMTLQLAYERLSETGNVTNLSFI